MIKIDYIQEYLVLAETLNFSKTAEATYITQPALSRHIVMIEEEMGAKLFDRTTRYVRLTPAGEAVREQFKGIMQKYQYAKVQAKAFSAGESGVLVVNSPYYWTEDYTEPVVEAFMEEYPDCDIKIRSVQPTPGFQDMLEGRGDLVFNIALPQVDPIVRRVPFAEERLAVIMRADHPLAERESMRLSDLACDEELVLLELAQSDKGNYNSSLLALLGEHDITPRELHYAEQVDTLGLVIRKTGSVSIVPYGIRHMDRSYLRTVPLEDEDCVVDLCMYYLVENTNVLVPRFVQMAREMGDSIGSCAGLEGGGA